MRFKIILNRIAPMCIDQCNGSYPRGQQGGPELLIDVNTQREMVIQLFLCSFGSTTYYHNDAVAVAS